MSLRLSSISPFPPVLSAKTHQKPEVRMPSLNQVKVADIFHRLVSTSVPTTLHSTDSLGFEALPCVSTDVNQAQ